MFFNKNKIPSDTIKTDIVSDEDLFFYDNDDDSSFVSDTYKASSNLDDYQSGDIDFSDTRGDEISIDDEEVYDKSSDKINLLNRIATIVLICVSILGSMIFLDVIFVTRLNIGPFFAIRIKVHNDGGSKEYYGLFYKVIKYKQSGGRVGTTLGSWSLKYSTVATDVDMIDLAIDFNNNNEYKYMNNFVKVKGEVLSNTRNSVILMHLDDGGKYTTRLVCNMASPVKGDISSKSVSLVGTIYDYKDGKTKTIYMKNCFVR